jgi:hypothetical protein
MGFARLPVRPEVRAVGALKEMSPVLQSDYLSFCFRIAPYPDWMSVASC